MRESPEGTVVLQLRGEKLGERGEKACLLIVTSRRRRCRGALIFSFVKSVFALHGERKKYVAECLRVELRSFLPSFGFCFGVRRDVRDGFVIVGGRKGVQFLSDDLC
jgi:hypothetical protein